MAVSVKGKIILDTNVFVDYLRFGGHAEWVEGRIQETFRFLSAIVVMELVVGADKRKRKRVISRLFSSFPRNRIVAPTGKLYFQAGRLFRKMFPDEGSFPSDRLAPMNDILIALTARSIGATLVTENVRDFRRISEHLRGLRFVRAGSLRG